MRNIFVFTASNPIARKHLSKTIENSIDEKKVLPHFRGKELEKIKRIGEKNGYYAWGALPGKSRRGVAKPPNIRNWEAMNIGDYVFVYQHKKLTYYSRILYKTKNRNFAKDNWTKINGQYFEYIYFLEKPIKIDPPVETRTLEPYMPSSFMGFSKIKNERVKKIIEDYGSIENFINIRLIKQKQHLIEKPLNDNLINLTHTMETSKKLNRIHKYIISKGFYFTLQDIANFYLALKTKPFVILAGISGTGKTQLARKFAEAISATAELIPVKPDWTDNSDLIGYVDLQDNFREEKIIYLIKKAIKYPDKIYFAILDEMNLARVEHYFSDFLSIIETRSKEEDNKIKTDKLIDERTLEKIRNREKLKDLYIPDNLYIIGTVNMDETTHPFSRKVLDRANSIELNEVNLDWVGQPEENITPDPSIKNDFLKAQYINSKDLSDRDKRYLSKVLKKLKKLNEILKIADLHFGYRVRDEVCFYMLYQRDIRDILNYEEAFDYQIMQKILPRIQGNSLRIKEVIIRLIKELSGSGDISPNIDYQELEKVIEKPKEYKRSINKLLFMLRRFEDDGFTSFWL